jgi:DNA polymerase
MPRAVTYNPLAKTLAEMHVPVSAEYIDEILLPAIRSGEGDACLTGGPNTMCANALRHCIIADAGNELIVADYKNIESRVLAWIAGEVWKLAAYAAADRGEGEDLYRLLFHRFFGVPLDEINEHQRNSGKVVELACGFGGSVAHLSQWPSGTALIYLRCRDSSCTAQIRNRSKRRKTPNSRRFVRGDDYDLDPWVYIAIHVLVQAYRAANLESMGSNGLWVKLSPTRLKSAVVSIEVGRCKIWANADLLIVELPSGYRLCYWEPKVEIETVQDEITGEDETAPSCPSSERAESTWSKNEAGRDSP